MNKPELFNMTFVVLENAFRKLEEKVEAPELADLGFGPVFRFPRKTLEAAIIQKLARVISGLRGCRILLEEGMVQEIATLQRTIDEFREDVFFLSDPLVGGKRTPLHDQFLEAFFQEEFDAKTPFESSQRRPQVPRPKIQAHLARMECGLNPSDAQELQRTIAKVYGGYIHGASSQIMETYGGNPPRFHILGMKGTPREQEYARALVNYFYRGFQACEIVALAFRVPEVSEDLRKFRELFEGEIGESFDRTPDEIRKMIRR